MSRMPVIGGDTQTKHLHLILGAAVLALAVFLPLLFIALTFLGTVLLLFFGLGRSSGQAAVNDNSGTLNRPEPAPQESSQLVADDSGMFAALRSYYIQQGIYPADFRCPYWKVCAEGEPRFTTAKASFVGPEYERGTLPRLLFLSLDSGDGSPDPNERTLQSVRRIELSRNVHDLHKAQHWYQTHEFAAYLLSAFDASLRPDRVIAYFAHVNTAKCSVNNPARREAPDKLAQHCRRYLPEELRILKPDVIVSQGGKARRAIEEQFRLTARHERRLGGTKAICGVIAGLTERGTLWIATPHPSAYGVYWKHKDQCWALFRSAVTEFAAGRPLPW